MSKCLWKDDRFWALTTTCGNLLQCLATLSLKKCFLVWSLDLSCCSFESLIPALSLDPKETFEGPSQPRLLSGSRRWDQPLPLHGPSSGRCREQWPLRLFLFQPDKPGSSAAPQRTGIPCPWLWCPPPHPFCSQCFPVIPLQSLWSLKRVTTPPSLGWAAALEWRIQLWHPDSWWKYWTEPELGIGHVVTSLVTCH